MRLFPMTSSLLLAAAALAAAEPVKYDYRLLATSRTSTMEKEMNAAAAAGFSFGSVMGGESAMGGKEVVVVMVKKSGGEAAPKKSYKLLATSRTSTLQKEMQQAGAEGFDYCGQTIFQSSFGGKEVSVILERDPAAAKSRVDFKLLATSRTSTMEKELREAGQSGYEFLNVMVGATALGGKEVVSILRRYPD
jgi:hypothetical protein